MGVRPVLPSLVPCCLSRANASRSSSECCPVLTNLASLIGKQIGKRGRMAGYKHILKILTVHYDFGDRVEAGIK